MENITLNAEQEQAVMEAAEKISEDVVETTSETVVSGYTKIENGVVSGYKKIEEGVVGGYKKIEEGVVGGFSKLTDKFVGAFFTREGETVEQAKERMQGNITAQQEAARETAEAWEAKQKAMIEASLEASRNAGKRY